MAKGIQIRNWLHFKLIKDLDKKRSEHMKKLRSQDDDFDSRPNVILYGNVDRFTAGWENQDRQTLLAYLKEEVNLNPLRSNKGLSSTDNLRGKIYPYLNRNGIRNNRPGHISYLKRPDMPIPLVKNVLRIDLGMANTIENNVTLNSAGWTYPERDEVTRYLRIGMGGLTYHTICGMITKREPKFGADGKKNTDRKVLEMEIITIPNVILDKLIGPRREDGLRSTSEIPECWKKWRSAEVDEAVRKGRSSQVELPEDIKPVRGDGQKNSGQKKRGRKLKTRRGKDDNSSSPDPHKLKDDYSYLTVKELRDLCTKHKLKRGGNKTELLVRLSDAGKLD